MYIIVWEINIFSIITATIAGLSLIYNLIITNKSYKIKRSELYYFVKAEIEAMIFDINSNINKLNNLIKSFNEIYSSGSNFILECEKEIIKNESLAEDVNHQKTIIEIKHSKIAAKELQSIKADLELLKKAIIKNSEMEQSLHDHLNEMFKRKSR